MDSSIIVLDSDDEEFAGKEVKPITAHLNGKRHNDESNQNGSPPIKQRRVQPVKIGEVDLANFETSSSQDNKSDAQPLDNTISVISSTGSTSSSSKNSQTKDDKNNKDENNDTSSDAKHKNEVTKELEAFINACRKAENNSDMKKIIKTKLIKYYDLVHPEYAQSKHLRKMLEDTALAILRDPKSVYTKLQEIISELKSRKSNGQFVPVATEQSQSESQNSEENGIEVQETGDEKKDNRLKKLNKALVKLKKAIEALEEEEVNLDEDEDSAYMKKVRFEKRAIEIYNKICEITGESSDAHRIVKQPIKFKNSKYKEFNKKLSKKINKESGGFPSFYDVYRLLDFCNKEYKYGLLREEIQNIAQLAFVEVGKLLKERRCNDLYESAEHYAGKNKDPAKEDPELKAKLEKNKEYYKKKTEEILQLFVTKQLNGEEGETEEGEPSSSVKREIPEPSSSSAIAENKSPTNENTDLQEEPTKKILSIIDIKAECDINGDDNKSSTIDLAISL